ncbi:MULTISPECIES: helix-turn-helix transcriptional regulator [unclassified Curtobacterium]|jgi:transcriptional regulator with XRE-family HTH domain|uniref:helix-turn-helix transcriptional regulator n=1 Tax=Bacteria TaxID=2 RepID=UPI000F5073C1|nr:MULTISPECIES: helix-turn-helix transcriptional regulator [unclassified Curtobacterium]NQW90030.1 helix-turn-helix domain-containing protein [Curtobacterium sp. VKM Ac-2861]MBF4586381.1 helix-turn-helix domain-containing protein [Curtobacterium sp. VKM Ac-2887]RPE84592.1 transcriptional regulator with XRE-family HTH domain [Curtobacterium sp. PhB137]TCL79801.1 transcriptional regulator with XRE-family HTH domain [Curtobacterium sp. PhB128]TCL98025.1 transcriptional regulator with XRE-family 
MNHRDEARDFLSSRRARITPEQAGVETFGTRRRVTGLRREEVARLAGVSIDYYTRLERGNLQGVSDSVLEAVAGALQLDAAELEHLRDLSRHQNATPRRAGKVVPVAAVRPELQYLLDVITDAPAMIINNRQDIVAANALGYAMHSDLVAAPARPMNFSRFIFLDPQARNFYQDWQRAAHTNVAILRREAGRTPNDRDLAALIGELSMRSDDFRALWAAHDVRRHYAGVKSFRHAVVGPLELHFQTLELAEDPGLALTIYPATPGSPTADALRLLASWAATEQIAERARSAVSPG